MSFNNNKLEKRLYPPYCAWLASPVVVSKSNRIISHLRSHPTFIRATSPQT